MTFFTLRKDGMVDFTDSFRVAFRVIPSCENGFPHSKDGVDNGPTSKNLFSKARHQIQSGDPFSVEEESETLLGQDRNLHGGSVFNAAQMQI